jgi:hypothetical protein
MSDVHDMGFLFYLSNDEAEGLSSILASFIADDCLVGKFGPDEARELKKRLRDYQSSSES